MDMLSSQKSGYSQPPKHVLEVMNAPSPPDTSMSPSHDRIILIQWPNYPSIDQLSKPYLKLAGLRVQPRNHSRRDTPRGYGIRPGAIAFDILDIASGMQSPIKVPEQAFLSRPVWSADGKFFAFRNTTIDAVQLWVGNAQDGSVRCLPHVRLNPMFEDDVQWLAGLHTLIVKLIPDNMGAPPDASTSVSGPKIQEATGEKGSSSTYEARDTLTCPHDEDVFDYYGTSQLALIDAISLSVQCIGKSDRHLYVDPTPDGKHLLVETIERPYSYVTAYDRFPRRIEVWSISNLANVLQQHIVTTPLADRVPVNGVALGPRSISWRANVPSTLIWPEALDGGSWKVDVPHRDKIMKLEAPFTGKPVEIMRTENRFGGIYWGEKLELAIVTEYNSNTKWRRGFLTNIDDIKPDRPLVWDLSMNEKYNNPGHPVTHKLSNGAVVMYQDGNSIFFAGTGSSPDGDRPFLDKVDLSSLSATRMFRSSTNCLERFLAFDNSGSNNFFTSRQSSTDPPNVHRRTIEERVEAATGEAVFASRSEAVTHNADPVPIVRQIKTRLVSYERHDGVKLSFKLYTPPGHEPGTPLPTVLYAYPLDYADPTVAGQTSRSETTFVTLKKSLLLLLDGYAIIEASFPIVGDPKKAYDTYLEQLVANAEAAIKQAVQLGVTDPNRVVVTGHSHGAFMTVNLLAHSTLFKAGIATSGAYNRTLMPFGFQNERRSIWEAPELYMKVSPFFVVDKIKAPLLIMHGEDDANPGTPPAQANMLFEAIRGNGGVAKLVVLPHEPHWYTAQESNEQVIFEMLSWLKKYLGPAETDAAVKAVKHTL